MEFTIKIYDWVIVLFASIGGLGLIVKAGELIVDVWHKRLLNKQWKIEDERARKQNDK